MYLFCDLETPGLDPELGIIEIAWTITYDDYRPLMQGIESLFLDGKDVAPISEWDEYVSKMHETSGLLATWHQTAVDKATVPLKDAEQIIMSTVRAATNIVPEPVILAGNSPHGVDRPFIRRWMPELDKTLHYRHHDVRTLISFWESLNTQHGVPDSEAVHRAAQDIEWSLAVCRAYRDAMEKTLFPTLDMDGLQ